LIVVNEVSPSTLLEMTLAFARGAVGTGFRTNAPVPLSPAFPARGRRAFFLISLRIEFPDMDDGIDVDSRDISAGTEGEFT
jgi:hypothetical protein